MILKITMRLTQYSGTTVEWSVPIDSISSKTVSIEGDVYQRYRSLRDVIADLVDDYSAYNHENYELKGNYRRGSGTMTYIRRVIRG